MDDINLSGRVALVTGGGRGLGRAFAEALAQAGADVAVVARTADQLSETVTAIEGTGRHGLALTADVTDRLAVERAMAEAEQRLGPIDLLVNNAGALNSTAGPTSEVDPEDWWRVMEVNVRGPFLCARAVLPSMIGRRQGRIINIASGAGLGRIAYGSSYGISKTALIRFSEQVAGEVAEYGVRVFSIHPGTIRTGLNEHLLESEAGQRWLPWFKRIFDEGRDLTPEPAAHLILRLASGEADALSGCFISVDDNLSDLVRQAEAIRANSLYTLRLKK